MCVMAQSQLDILKMPYNCCALWYCTYPPAVSISHHVASALWQVAIVRIGCHMLVRPRWPVFYSGPRKHEQIFLLKPTYIYEFDRCTYLNQLTVHSSCMFLWVCVFPRNWTYDLCTTNARLNQLSNNLCFAKSDQCLIKQNHQPLQET